MCAGQSPTHSDHWGISWSGAKRPSAETAVLCKPFEETNDKNQHTGDILMDRLNPECVNSALKIVLRLVQGFHKKTPWL